jgi:hypothetical protein
VKAIVSGLVVLLVAATMSLAQEVKPKAYTLVVSGAR